MKIVKYILFVVLIVIGVFALASAFMGYPIVLDFSKQIEQNKSLYQKGETIKPFENFDFNKGEWIAYLLINGNDKKQLSKSMPNGDVFITTDKELLKQIQREWVFIYTGGDVATVQSSIILYNNEKKVFESGIILDEGSQGLQSMQFGWLESSSLIKSCSQFKKIDAPILILN